MYFKIPVVEVRFDWETVPSSPARDNIWSVAALAAVSSASSHEVAGPRHVKPSQAPQLQCIL